MRRKGLSETEPTEPPFFFSPHAEEGSGSARGAGEACGEKLVKGARAAELLRALERSVAVGPEELTRLAPAGGLLTADERTEGSILAKLLVRVGGSVLIAAELGRIGGEGDASASEPLTLEHAYRRAQRSWAERSELGGFLSRLRCV